MRCLDGAFTDRAGWFTAKPLGRRNALHMVKRRAIAAEQSASTCNHTFRATGITAHLEIGGTIEKAQQIAAHESPKTTKLYEAVHVQRATEYLPDLHPQVKA